MAAIGCKVLLVLWGVRLLAQAPDISAIAKKALPAVVTIEGDKGSGAGFIISQDGLIVTCVHVVEGQRGVRIRLTTGEMFDSLLVRAFDARKDLAVLKVAGFELPKIELGNSSDLMVGQPVIAVGNPLGLTSTVTSGIVSAIRDDPGLGYRLIQTDAPVNPGNSGGPLLNSAGAAVGVVTLKMVASETLNFAVPINYVRGMLAEAGSPISLAEFQGRLELGGSEARTASLRAWVGTWLLAGPVQEDSSCLAFPSRRGDLTFRILSVDSDGAVAARVRHPQLLGESADEYLNSELPDWSGKAEEGGVVLTMIPMKPDLFLANHGGLRETSGRLENSTSKTGSHPANLTYFVRFYFHQECTTWIRYLGTAVKIR